MDWNKSGSCELIIEISDWQCGKNTQSAFLDEGKNLKLKAGDHFKKSQLRIFWIKIFLYNVYTLNDDKCILFLNSSISRENTLIKGVKVGTVMVKEEDIIDLFVVLEEAVILSDLKGVPIQSINNRTSIKMKM